MPCARARDACRRADTHQVPARPWQAAAGAMRLARDRPSPRQCRLAPACQPEPDLVFSFSPPFVRCVHPGVLLVVSRRTGVPAVLHGEALDDCATHFAPPVPEFAVQRIAVSAARSTPYQLTEAPSAAVVLCVSGKGEAVVKDDDDGETARERNGTSLRPPTTGCGVAYRLRGDDSLRCPVHPWFPRREADCPVGWLRLFGDLRSKRRCVRL